MILTELSGKLESTPEVKWHPKQARLQKPVKEYCQIISRALQATVWNETVSSTDKWPPKYVEKM